MKKKKFNIGIIGAGITANEYLKSLSYFKEINLSAIYTRSQHKAKKLVNKYKSLKVSNSIDEMYSNERIDLVIVVVSLESILDVALKVLDYPWKILFEKPLGISYLDYKIIEKKILQKNRDVHIALNRRNYSSTKKLIKLLNSSTGKRIIEINDQEDISQQIKNKRSKKIIKNWMYCNSIHLIDYSNFLSRGKVKNVKNIFPWKMGNDKVLSIIEYTSGDIVIYKAIWNKPYSWSVKITTNEKFFYKEPIESLSYRTKESRKVISIKIDKYEKNFKPGFFNQSKEVIKYLKKKKHNLASFKENKKTMNLIRRIYEL